MKNNKQIHSQARVAALAFLLTLSLFSAEMQAKQQVPQDGLPEACTEIQSPLNRLACFDEYFKTPIHIPEQQQQPAHMPKPQPEILTIANRMENDRMAETAGLLHESSIEHEAAGQQRVILTAPALGSLPPRPLLIISCINNITRFQLGLQSPINSTSVKATLTLNGRSVGGDYHWRVLGYGQMIDAGHGIPSIRILKKIVGHDRLLINTGESSLQGLIFDISDFTQHIKAFRTACHW